MAESVSNAAQATVVCTGQNEKKNTEIRILYALFSSSQWAMQVRTKAKNRIKKKKNLKLIECKEYSCLVYDKRRACTHVVNAAAPLHCVRVGNFSFFFYIYIFRCLCRCRRCCCRLQYIYMHAVDAKLESMPAAYQELLLTVKMINWRQSFLVESNDMWN